ncbi:unnamed protein product [Ceratitis capitata]|uniref:(Mediterranean fruit fly) hypothetical protein n=1 Tax=Ceratitis capitata TaxID=7213 RepID=A0A811VG89_CERCA|nr:unnamed protein product [Ceratitis capitata]
MNIYGSATKLTKTLTVYGDIEWIIFTGCHLRKFICFFHPGRLETDALPVDDNEETPTTNNNTPTPSTELTESVVRELSDPNYNSVEAATSGRVFGAESGLNSNTGALALQTYSNNALTPTSNDSLTPTTPGALTPTTMNTMNVHNAQQQMVMQFSNINNCILVQFIISIAT